MNMQTKIENLGLLVGHPDWPVFTVVSDEFGEAFEDIGDDEGYLMAGRLTVRQDKFTTLNGLEYFWADGEFDDPEIYPEGFNPEEAEWTPCLVIEVEDVL